MKRLLGLVLLLAAPAFAQTDMVGSPCNMTDGSCGASSYSTMPAPSGCVATSVPFFLGSPVALGCDPGLTYDADGNALVLVGLARPAAPTVTEVLYTKGQITPLPGSGLVDGETFSLNDGLSTYTYEFDSGGGVTPGNFAVPFTAGSTLEDVTAAVISAWNASGIRATAVDGGYAVLIRPTVPGITNPIVKNVGGYGFNVYGLANITPSNRTGLVTYSIVARNATGQTAEGPPSAAATLYEDLAETDPSYNRITWAAVPGATSYDVYRRDASGQPGDGPEPYHGKINAAPIVGTSFDDTGEPLLTGDLSPRVVVDSSASITGPVVNAGTVTTTYAAPLATIARMLPAQGEGPVVAFGSEDFPSLGPGTFIYTAAWTALGGLVRSDTIPTGSSNSIISDEDHKIVVTRPTNPPPEADGWMIFRELDGTSERYILARLPIDQITFVDDETSGLYELVPGSGLAGSYYSVFQPTETGYQPLIQIGPTFGITSFGWRAGVENYGLRVNLFGTDAGYGNEGFDVIAIGDEAAKFNSFSNVVVIGTGASATAENQVVLGNGDTVEVLAGGTGTAKLKAGTATFGNLPEYADNAAAVTGGLATGDLYRTATGVVMVVLP